MSTDIFTATGYWKDYGLEVCVYRSSVDGKLVVELNTAELEEPDVHEDTAVPNIRLYINEQAMEFDPDGTIVEKEDDTREGPWELSIPDPHNPGMFRSEDFFRNKQDALKTAQETWGADKTGRISIINYCGDEDDCYDEEDE